ncbi:MAG: hypothetical protein ACE10C_01925 [Candidatus Binatia bacterium]
MTSTSLVMQAINVTGPVEDACVLVMSAKPVALNFFYLPCPWFISLNV